MELGGVKVIACVGDIVLAYPLWALFQLEKSESDAVYKKR